MQGILYAFNMLFSFRKVKTAMHLLCKIMDTTSIWYYRITVENLTSKKKKTEFYDVCSMVLCKSLVPLLLTH